MVVATQVTDAIFQKASDKMSQLGLQSRWYTIPDFDGFSSIDTQPATTVYTLETHIGPSQVPGYETYAVAQTFSEAYPSLSLVFLVERDADGVIGTHQPVFNIKNEDNWAGTFLPAMNRAFNPLDRAEGREAGVMVQLYHASMTLGDILQASQYTFKLTSSFKKDGQLAQIAVDFDDPIMTVIGKLSQPLASLIAGGDLYQFPKTETPSQIRIPVEDGKGGYHIIDHSSTALDEGIKTAMTYLDKPA